MKTSLGLIALLTGLMLLAAACTSSAPPPATAPTTPASPAKPADSAKKPASAKTATDSPKTDADKKSIPTAKKVEVPKDWVTVYDDAKGYEFEIPDGSETYDDTIGGVDVFAANLPGGKVQVLVVAYKDRTLTREDLLNDAEGILTNLGSKDIKVDNLVDLSDDYGLADAVFTDSEGKKSKVKILVATDVTDNYIMIVGCDEVDYKANEQIVDQVWGSFAMWSGGASGGS